MTCGSSECKREWHRRRCAQWNKENADYFKANYLRRKIKRATLAPAVQRRLGGKELVKEIQEVIGIQHLIIMEYFGQLLIRRFQEVMKVQHSGIFIQKSQLPPLFRSVLDLLRQ